MNKQVVILRSLNGEILKKYWITKQSINDIYNNTEYIDSLKILCEVNKTISIEKIELKLIDLDEIQVEAINNKISNCYGIVKYSTFEKFILSYAEELSSKVNDDYISSLLSSIGSGDSIKEKAVIFRELGKKLYEWRRNTGLNKLGK